MSILPYEPMGILIISKMVSNLRICYLNQLKTNMQHFYCLIMTTLEPSKGEWQDVCSFCSSRSSLWVPGGKTA